MTEQPKHKVNLPAELIDPGRFVLAPKARSLLAQLQRREQRRELAGIKTLVEAVKQSDAQRFRETLSRYQCDGDLLKRAFRGIARLSLGPSRDFQAATAQIIADWGDGLRCELGDDLLLCDALRVLLAPYQGPAPLRLYRGEQAWNRKRRTYGASWSRDRVVADSFAKNRLWCTAKGGTVLLETDAPLRAIIGVINADREEEEVIVDRRYLKSVRVLARYQQRDV
jgi:hypothetical protein